ncbi:MAG: acetyl-CoA carboxylase biotin carboxyl carrier protein [Planctomycetes bacterium]|nr:acetyl-CoA carboxylase biotin carboxyl carrier protein [Planctomycetota bacterium]
MAGSPSNQDIFDVRKIRRLVELMNEHDLAEMDLRQGETRIQLRRAGDATVAGSAAAAVPPLAASAPAPRPAEPARQAAAQDAESPPAEDHLVAIESPMVGTFYASPDPDASAYVKVGDHVGPETTICIVEAMKVFNEIQAEVSGKVVAVLVENGEPVEFGQPMFKLDTRQ